MELELFVPGRVCLLGEHSDWAGGFRRFNKTIEPGVTLVTGTNQGIYARVKPHPSKLIVTSTNNGGKKQHIEISMDKEVLLEVAREGGFWSYIAGVAYKLSEDHVVGGLVIDNYMTTLPLGKGLSSSAAICVLVARAFNKLYHLRLTVRGEMEYAYQGELITPSQCGRLDQACAFGSTAVKMVYDGEFTGVEKLNVALPLHYVVVDLRAEKDTTAILDGLQSAYPFPQGELHMGLHECLGKENRRICSQAESLITGKGTGELSRDQVIVKLGSLMSEAQALFDRYAAPLCPAQLTAPALHKCLHYEPIQHLITGGKYVGAGGDGTAQLLCKDADSQNEVARIIKDELLMDPILLSISPSRRIKCAVVTSGGFSPALFPASHACKTELFPILDPKDGLCKPLILGTIEQLLDAGLENIFIVIQEDDLHQFKRLFEDGLVFAKLQRSSAHDQSLETYARNIVDMGRRVQYIIQDGQSGFGHAVYCARNMVGSNPFLLVLGHHLYVTSENESRSCVEQILDSHRQLGTNVIGLKTTPLSQVSQFGTVAGTFSSDGILQITAVHEKPTTEFAQANLHVDGLASDDFLTMFGMYALEPRIFDILGSHIAQGLRDSRGEIGFTTALAELRHEAPLFGTVISGERLAITSSEAFVQTNQRLLHLYTNRRQISNQTKTTKT